MKTIILEGYYFVSVPQRKTPLTLRGGFVVLLLQSDGQTNRHHPFSYWINQDPHIVFNLGDKYLCM